MLTRCASPGNVLKRRVTEQGRLFFSRPLKRLLENPESGFCHGVAPERALKRTGGFRGGASQRSSPHSCRHSRQQLLLLHSVGANGTSDWRLHLDDVPLWRCHRRPGGSLRRYADLIQQSTGARHRQSPRRVGPGDAGYNAHPSAPGTRPNRGKSEQFDDAHVPFPR